MNKSQRPKIIKNFPSALSTKKARHRFTFIALRTARCQFWKVYLEIRENLLLRYKLSLFSAFLWCSPFEADWWRIASARRSSFLFGTFALLKVCFASYSRRLLTMFRAILLSWLVMRAARVARCSRVREYVQWTRKLNESCMQTRENP